MRNFTIDLFNAIDKHQNFTVLSFMHRWLHVFGAGVHYASDFAHIL